MTTKTEAISVEHKRTRKELALKIYCGIIDQSWGNVDNCLAWVECVLVNDLMNIKDDIYKKLEDTPLCLEYETDARDVWPKRWKNMLGVINDRI